MAMFCPHSTGASQVETPTCFHAAIVEHYPGGHALRMLACLENCVPNRWFGFHRPRNLPLMVRAELNPLLTINITVSRESV